MNATAIDRLIARHLVFERGLVGTQAAEAFSRTYIESLWDLLHAVESWQRVRDVLQNAHEADLERRIVDRRFDNREFQTEIDRQPVILAVCPEVVIVREEDGVVEDGDVIELGTWQPRRVLRSGNRLRMERVRPYPPRR